MHDQNFKGTEPKVVFEWLRFVDVRRVGKGGQSTCECQLYDVPHRYNTAKVLSVTCSRKSFSMADVRL